MCLVETIDTLNHPLLVATFGSLVSRHSKWCGTLCLTFSVILEL